MAPRWLGPYKFVETISPYVFRLSLMEQSEQHIVAHVIRIKRFAGPQLNETVELQQYALHVNHRFEVEEIVDWRLEDSQIQLKVQ